MFSEPELIINIADSIPNWAVFLGLIGEGQEIHKGEDGGIQQWRNAIMNSNNKWKVVCPSKLANIFQNIAKVEVIVKDELNLNVTLRYHLVEDVSIWVNELLNGNIKKANALSPKIKKQGFKMYVTRYLDKAKNYCSKRYSNDEEKRYGLIASSKAQILPKFGVDNSYVTTKNLDVGAWFNNKPNNEFSCCQMKSVATEFVCQGLELDMPIICWGDDMIWDKTRWKINVENKFRINSYRVLLTCGRDGFIIFVPDHKNLDGVYKALVYAGVESLKNT